MTNIVSDIPPNCVAVAGVIVLGILAYFLIDRGIDTFLIETILVLIGGLCGYKLKESIDKKTIEELTKAISSDSATKS